VNIIGYGFGPPIIGRLNDMVGVAQNPSAMVYGLLICPVACLVAALLLFAASRSLRAASVKQ
jgi:MFS family permease